MRVNIFTATGPVLLIYHTSAKYFKRNRRYGAPKILFSKVTREVNKTNKVVRATFLVHDLSMGPVQ